MSQKLRLALLSNAGGSGKTTVATHLTYLLAKAGYKTILFDLDPQGSMNLFGNLEAPDPNETVGVILDDGFNGDYPLVPLWAEHLKDKAMACRGSLSLVESSNELVLHQRGAYLLGDRLEDFPLDCDVILYDCPATLGPLPQLAVSASTHILVPTQPEPKAVKGAAELLEWLYSTFRTLRLKPEPQIVGFVPNQYNKNIAIHRNIVEQLPAQLDEIGIHCFKPIRESAEFKNASGAGLPLHLHRPAHPACKDFEPILKALLEVLKNG